MDNQISVDWDTITGAYDQAPLFPITLIDTEVLDYWCTHPTVWEVARNLQHSRWVLAIVCRTLPEGNKGKPAVMFGASLVYIPARQARTNLSDTLSYLKHTKGDCIVLVSMPIKLTYSPQPRGNWYFTLLPINGNSGVDHGPLSSFAVATLHVASREGWGDNMAVWIKLPPCLSSSKCTKYELIMEAVLSRGPLWHNVHYVECKNNGEVIVSQNGQPLRQELEVSLCPSGGRLEYMSTGAGHPPPLTLVVCHPRWDDFQDLGETVAEMSQCLIDEDGQLEGAMPKGGTLPKEKDSAQIMALPPNDDTVFMPKSDFRSGPYGAGTRENPVNLSDATTEASQTAMHPEGAEPVDEAAMLGHFSNALSEMAKSLMDLEDGYFKALREVIIVMERALWDVSRIDAHYVSQVVTVMASWQEVVQTAATHMENTDLTIYLAHQEDMWRVMREYVAAMIKACEDRDATHANEAEAWKQAIKSSDPEDPVVCLLDATCWVAHAQAERAVDAFLKKINETLHKHVPVAAQGPLIVNALSTTFQFQMSVWWMVGDECIRPLWAKHSDWCGMAGVVQAIVETFPNNCAIMFPQAPLSAESFSTTFRPVSSKEEDDNEPINRGICRFKSSTPMPSGHGRSRSGHSLAFSSTPLLHGGCFILSSDQKEPPSSSLGAPPLEGEDPGLRPLDEDLDAGLEANDEGNGEKDPGEGEDPNINATEIEMLQGIINPGTHGQTPALPKSGDKRGSGHLGTSISSDSSAKDLDAKDARPKKKVSTPVKAASSNTGQWTNKDLDVVHQIRYKTDLDCFQTYRHNKITPADLSTINTKDHSAYIDIAKAHPGTVVKKSVFSFAAY